MPEDDSIDKFCEEEDEILGESSDNLGLPLYTNVTEYIIHNA